MRTPVLTAEEAFVGTMMWLGADVVTRVHHLVREEDLASPAVRLVYRLAGQLADTGIDPHPVAVLSLATAEGHVEGASRVQEFALLLARLFDHRATVPAAITFYAEQTLEQAERRRVMEMTARLSQIADHADLDELARLQHAEIAAVDGIRTRRAAIRPEVAA